MTLTVITGPMFSGKTEELIRLVRREEIGYGLDGTNTLKPVVFKPARDTRDAEDVITSHSGYFYKAESIGYPTEALKYSGRVIAFDEAQFFHRTLEYVVQCFLDGGSKVYVAGLDKDFKGEPFGPMPYLLAMADHVEKLTAICMVCGGDATMTYRTTQDKETIVIGGKDKYEARCRKCWKL